MKRSLLLKRSQLFQQLRTFFYARSVIEVDTPMLSVAGAPDCHLSSLTTQVQVPGEREPQPYYLHTSPEYPMKRLLCEGSGDIFYLGKVFRDGDLSPRHQVEFMMLEWYRIGFSMQDLIEEVVVLLQHVLNVPPNLSPPETNAKRTSTTAEHALRVEQLTYQQAFAKYANISNIFEASASQCQACLSAYGNPEIVGVAMEDKGLWEQLVLTEVIEPQLGREGENLAITVLSHYPVSQAALAQISSDNPLTSERFEVFVKGMELANGYHELREASLYQTRFEASLNERVQQGFSPVALDERLLTTLTQTPLPDCSGVALGVDRLFALQQGFDDIQQGIAFGLLES